MNQEEKIRLARTQPGWMYEFDLGDGVITPLLSKELRSIHTTRERMIFPLLDKLYPKGLGGAGCLDIACYFSHLLYDRGGRVTGLDIRQLNIERARLIAELQARDPARLRFEVVDMFQFEAAPETFEVTMFLGLLYHIEDPMGALRRIYKWTRTACFMETQLTRQKDPIVSGWGQTGVFMNLSSGMAIHEEPDAGNNNLASFKTLSFIPNAAAVRQMFFAAGVKQVMQIAAPPGSNLQYVAQDRGVFLALK